jgi:hypothetical protein
MDLGFELVPFADANTMRLVNKPFSDPGGAQIFELVYVTALPWNLDNLTNHEQQIHKLSIPCPHTSRLPSRCSHHEFGRG